MNPPIEFEFQHHDPIPPTFPVSSTGTVCGVWAFVRLLPFLVYRYIRFFPQNPAARCGSLIAAAGIDFWFTQNIAGPLLFGIQWSATMNKRTVVQIAHHLWWMLFVPPGCWALMLVRYVIERKATAFYILLMIFLLAGCNSWCFWKVSAEGGVRRSELCDGREDEMVADGEMENREMECV
jgi:hypothetical protein